MLFKNLVVGEQFYLRSLRRRYTKINDNTGCAGIGKYCKRHFFLDDIVFRASEIKGKQPSTNSRYATAQFNTVIRWCQEHHFTIGAESVDNLLMRLNSAKEPNCA